jgi:hypothetical protein
MSANKLTRALQFSYPLAIFLAALAGAGMSLVQASNFDLRPRLPSRGDGARTLITVCSIDQDRGDPPDFCAKPDSFAPVVDRGPARLPP